MGTNDPIVLTLHGAHVSVPVEGDGSLQLSITGWLNMTDGAYKELSIIGHEGFNTDVQIELSPPEETL